MELKNIKTFLKVAANQNLSKTAEEIGYSQSAVTVQIQKLENELNVQLFERIGKRIFLTEQGSAFLPYAKDIVKATEAAISFSQKESSPKGVIRIGGVESICTAVLPELLPRFYKLCPNVSVVVRSGYTNKMLELLDTNDLDTVFTLDEKLARSELIREASQEEPIIFVTTPKFYENTFGFPWKKNAIISPDILCSAPFILPELQAPYRYRFEQMLADRNLFVHPFLEIGNTETIINLLKKDMGVSLLPKFTVENHINNHQLIEIKTDLPSINMHKQLFCHKGKWITPQLKIFINLVQSIFAKNK